MTEAGLANPQATFDPERVVAAARSWIGTPYRHQASLRGAGADCLGLVRGVWRELLGPEPEPTPSYSRGWAEEGDGEAMLAACARWLVAAPPGGIAAGEVLLFRVRRRRSAQHAGIATGARTMVHAYDGHAVAETPIPEAWAERLAARFRFPSR
jgi:NlpC/P60 family putative phage cell wall peptidase